MNVTLTFLLLTVVVAAAALKLQQHTQLSHQKFYLGEHDNLHGYAFVHYHHNHGTLKGPPVQRKRQPTMPTLCTAPIAQGARWRSAEGYYVHTRNTQGLSEEYITTSMARAMDVWGCATGSLELDVIGPRLGVRRNVAAEDFVMDRPTGENEIGFGPIEGRPGTVAVTVVWGIFGGALENRRISEFKMRFDEEHYRFGNATLGGRAFMDLEAIATHEAGHAHGLDDIYTGPCGHVTMFGTSRTGETKKRSLAGEDVDGLANLYD